MIGLSLFEFQFTIFAEHLHTANSLSVTCPRGMKRRGRGVNDHLPKPIACGLVNGGLFLQPPASTGRGEMDEDQASLALHSAHWAPEGTTFPGVGQHCHA